MIRNEFQAVFAKVFLHHLILERERLQITQEQMSEILAMSIRAYANLEHGKTSCSALTLVLFLLYCCEDRIRFLDELEAALEDAYAAI